VEELWGSVQTTWQKTRLWIHVTNWNRRDFLIVLCIQHIAMFKPSTRHNIQPGTGAGPSSYAEVKLNKRQLAGNQLSARYPYRLNL